MIDYIVIAIILICLLSIIYYYAKRKIKGISGGCSSGCGHCSSVSCPSKKI